MSDFPTKTEESLAESLRRVEALTGYGPTSTQADGAERSPVKGTGSGSYSPGACPLYWAQRIWQQAWRKGTGWRRAWRKGTGTGRVRPGACPLSPGRGALEPLSPRDAVSVESLRRTCLDRATPSQARRSALAELSERLLGEPEYSAIVLTLLDDPDLDLARDAIASAPPFDAKVIGRLRDLLDDPRPEIWEAAALALARKKDHDTLPRILAWARRGDPAHRRAGLAAVAFMLIPEQHLSVVESICEDGPRDEEDEALLIDALRVADSRVAFWRRATKEGET